MTDESNPTPSAFPWGLKPGGGGEPAEPDAPAQPPAAPQPIALPPAAHEQPTQAMPVYPPQHYPATEVFAPEPPTEAYPAPLDPALDGVGDALAPHHIGHVDPVDEGLETSAIDSLFGDAAFVEYAEQPLIPVPSRDTPPARSGGELVVVPVGPKPQREPMPRTQRILLWVAGGLLAALALVVLFLVGTRLAPTQAPVAEPTPSAPAQDIPATGPLAPGEYAWTQLFGGECLQPFESAWQDTYTVVDCGEPHAGQLVARGVLDDAAATPYPGVDALQARVMPLCAAPTVIDFAAARDMVDIVVSASFPADAESWDAGERGYFCFVSRTGAEPLTTSLALAPAP